MQSKVVEKFMQNAIDRAKTSLKDVPCCALIVKNGEIISIQKNEREKNNIVSHHAEILALKEANQKLKNWRLDDCEMFVTLEPCPMCAWAIINSRIKNLYFGSYDTKYGAFGSALNLKTLAKSKINVFGGILEQDCDKLLKDYFERLRK